MVQSSALVLFGPAPCVGCRARAGWLCSACALGSLPPREGVVIKDVGRTYIPWSYEGAPRDLVLALKVRNMRGAAEPLVAAMARSCRAGRVDVDLITWVPTSRRDRARRGFDHAEVLARGVAQRLGIQPCGLLRRRGRQRDQVGLGRDQRRANLAGAFTSARLCGQRVLVADDLVTTGATAESCASALIAAGASSVEVVVACRA
jgi:predicted amidophosphoribosyltransferase